MISPKRSPVAAEPIGFAGTSSNNASGNCAVGVAIVWALSDSFRATSAWGITFGVLGALAFLVVVKLARKLAKLNREEEEEKMNSY